MSKTKHTPGPWYYDQMQWVREVSTDGIICAVTKTDGHIDMPTIRPKKANGTLLAAAPDLLAALEYILDQACENGCNHFGNHDGGESVEHSDACKDARAAISKAKGEK